MRCNLRLIRALCWMTAAVLFLQPVAAQSQRDPTIPPFGLGGSGGAGTGAAATRGVRAPLSVILVDGKFYLVVGTRLYAEGQKVGEARIERITETEVWLREGRQLRKVSNFVGVKRRNATDTAEAQVPDCAAPAATADELSGSTENATAAAACNSGQP